MTVSSFVFTNATGKVALYHDQAKTLGSPRGLIVVVIDRGAATDADMETATTLSGLLAGTANEVTNSGYARHAITAGGVGQLLLPSVTFDSGNNRMPCDLPDQTYATVAAGDAWTDAVVCYAPDTAGADSTLVPLTCNRNPITPDGSTLVVTITDYYRAAR